MARGVALLAMASYHFSWDLEFFGYLDPGATSTGFLKYYARSIASSFLFLAGVSLVWAHGSEVRWKSFGKRFSRIAAAAALVSIATYVTTPDFFVYFGILHVIAVLSLLGLAFLRLPAPLTLLMAAAAYIAGEYFKASIDVSWLMWLGMNAHPRPSSDFVPLIPWASAYLAGIAAANLLSLRNLDQRILSGPEFGNPVRNAFSWAGRHSLAIYLVHQPVLFAVVWSLSIVSPPHKPDPVLTYLNDCVAACSENNDNGFCTSFCECTLDELMAQNLFEPFQLGAIDADNNGRIANIAEQCTIKAQE